MTPDAADAAPPVRSRALDRVVHAVYYAMIVWIPVETLFVFDDANSKGGVTLSKILGLVLFCLGVVEWRRCFRKVPVELWFIAAYLAIFAASQLWIPRGLDGQFRAYLLSLIQLAALFLISANLFDDPSVRRTALQIFGWWVSLVALGMLSGVIGEPFVGQEGRVTLAGQDPNYTAALLALGAICVVGNSWVSGAKRFFTRMLAAAAAVVVLILAIFQTGSRGGLLAFVVGILALAVCGGKASRLKRLFIACAFILGLCAMVAREFQQGTTAASRLSNSWNDGDTAGRTEIYDVAWRMFQERPLFGYGGVNNYVTLGERLNYSEDGGYSRSTHNLLLALLTEVGLVGAVPFLAAMLFGLWKAWLYGRRNDDAIPFALLCALIAINTSLTWHHEKIFWIILAAAASCGQASRSPAAARAGLIAMPGLEEKPG